MAESRKEYTGGTAFEVFFYGEWNRLLDGCKIPEEDTHGDSHSWDRRAAYLLYKELRK